MSGGQRNLGTMVLLLAASGVCRSRRPRSSRKQKETTVGKIKKQNRSTRLLFPLWAGIAPLLQSLGMKQKTDYPSPMAFARSIHSEVPEEVKEEEVKAGGGGGGSINTLVERAEQGQVRKSS